MILISVLISSINSQLLILPLKSFKWNNIDLPTDNKKIKVSTYGESFATNWGFKGIHTELIVGNPPQKIITDLNQYFPDLTAEFTTNYQERENKNYFKESNTYKNITEIKEKIDNDHYATLLGTGEDVFNLNFYEEDSGSRTPVTKQIKANFEIDTHFYLGKRAGEKVGDIKSLNHYFNFAIGLQKGDSNTPTHFINFLRRNELISSYDFKYASLYEVTISFNTLVL